ncbi:Transcriptional regulator, family [Gammaproteobacteria bacterium]
MKTLNDLTDELMKDPEFKAAYDALAPEFELAHTVIAARAAQGLTQAELAARMNTTQSYIARLESGKVLPSMRTWLRLAAATNTRAKVTLEPLA